MEKAKRIVGGLLVACILLASIGWSGENAAAQAPQRQATIVVTYTENEWWMMAWETNQLLCIILVDHDGLPTAEEVLNACGELNYDLWLNTPPCTLNPEKKQSVNECEGVYLHRVSFQEKQRDVIVELPLPSVWVNLSGCTPTPPENLCPVIPTLILTGQEPLPNERITAINGLYDGVPFRCESSVCELPLSVTRLEGATIEFWADSSYGDTSERYTAQVRVIDTGVTAVPGAGGFYVDVISSQWQGAPIATCARIWEAFPPIGGPPPWLGTPDSTELIASDNALYYLAGRLIDQGLVDVRSCPNNGLLPNGYADTCGLERAHPLIDQWQDQFDTRILQAAKETGVPAQLMKNLFMQESQFWPGMYRVPYEYGLGQITDNGAEPVLLWNASFFDQFCPLVLAADKCAGGYLHLDKEARSILRGALALQARADCPGCSTGIDLSNATFSVNLFANTLIANCAQVNQSVLFHTMQTAGAVSNYEDLWRLTVANYHAGAGCVSYAIGQAWEATGAVTWPEVATRFTDPCKGVVPYVEKITR